MAPTVPIEFTGQKESRRSSLSQTMGKSRKYSKGHSSGFVPDYRHAIETIGESEGLGSSGRVDTEMTASEDSSVPNRKCISLNVDSYDGFSIPMQVLSMSRMSQSERKHLKLKLKMELEQVQLLQKKIESLSSNTGVLSPSSDIRSCSDGHKRPPLESSQRLSEVSTPLAKKQGPPGCSGRHTKKSSTGRFAPVMLPAPSTTANAMLMKQCETLLKRLRVHKVGWVFNVPVDVEKLKIPDYFTVIKHPMDLGTIESKLTAGEYSTPLDFAADVRLTFSNAMTYNPPGNDFHKMADDISRFFEARWKAIEKKIATSSNAQLMPFRDDDPLDAKNTTIMPPSKKKIIPSDGNVKQGIVKRVMTDEEKHKLGMELEALLGELPESVIDFLKVHSAGQTSEDEFEIDIDALSNDTLFSLRKLLDDCLMEKQKKETELETCEMEVINESGFSNSSIPPCKGIGHGDEDVDIVCGNNPPVSSYRTVEIVKDAAQRITKSSSSGGRSGSLSSDTNSASSSESESNAVKATGRLSAAKKFSGASSDQKRSGHGNKETDNDVINGVAQVEQNSEYKSISIEVDGHLEGESAPSDRQVSPDKLYRAAVLRNRFVDTILKAREKALEKDEKRDPEKLRKEREELERRQREEKARLQAEAKAAEEARKRAEAEAAVEARKKRELEREAARRALQDMEKTVDIDENTHFLESLPNFMEEASPELSQNTLGSFKLQGSNPLEQLGLYMKEDDEFEEEDVEPPQSNPEPLSIDVEEGEID